MRKSKWLKNLGFFLMHTCLALLLGELAVRILVPIPPKSTELPKVFVHEKSNNIKLLYKPSPNMANQAYGVFNKINSGGFRDCEYPVEKPAGTKRIIFLGDSAVYGYGLEIDKILPKQLEQRFKEHGEKVEVLNLGVSGYETQQQIEFFKEVGLKYKPDLVISGYTLNDSNYGSWELDLFHSLIDDKVLEPGKNLFKLFLTFLYEHSRLVSFLDERLKIQKKVKALRSYRTPIRRYMEDRNRKYRDPADSPYRQLEKQIMTDAERLGTRKVILDFMLGTIGFQAYDLYQSHWNISRKSFEELKQLSEEHSFEVVVVIFPIMRDMDKYPLDSLHHFLASEFEKIGFHVIDLLDFGKKIYAEHGFPDISGDGLHFSELGSKLVSEYLYEQIHDLDVLKSKS